MPPRLFRAFAICPLVPALGLAILNGIMGASLATIPMGILVYLPFAYFLALPFGSLTYLLLRRFNLRSCRAYGIAGALTGCVVASILPILMLGRLSAFAPGMDSGMLGLAALGSVTGIVFWQVAFGKAADGGGV